MIVFVRKTCFYSRHDGYNGVGFGGGEIVMSKLNGNFSLLDVLFIRRYMYYLTENHTNRKSCAFNFNFHCCKLHNFSYFS